MEGQVIHTSDGSKGEVRIVGAMPSRVKLTGTAAELVRRQAEARRELDRAVAAVKRPRKS